LSNDKFKLSENRIKIQKLAWVKLTESIRFSGKFLSFRGTADKWFVSINFKVICLEDLNVKGMMKNHLLAKAISDMGFYEFKRQIDYLEIGFRPFQNGFLLQKSVQIVVTKKPNSNCQNVLITVRNVIFKLVVI